MSNVHPSPCVYLDQSVFSEIASEVGTDWRQHEFGDIVSRASSAGKGEVWVSPTHVVETAQADKITRRSLAVIMLEMIESRRMGVGADAQLVREFFDFLEELAPGSVQRVYVDHHLETARRIWLGSLGLIGVTGSVGAGCIAHELRKHKAINRLLYARFAADPDGVLRKMISTVNELVTAPFESLENFDTRSTSDIDNEADNLILNIKGIAKHVRHKLDSNRAELSRAYGAFEVTRYLQQYLPLPMELELSFRCCPIIQAWPKIQAITEVQSLPKDVALSSEMQRIASPDIFLPTLQASVRAAASFGLFTGTVTYDIILRELQRMVNDKRIPSGSLTFDADHAAALTWCSVIVTRDIEFAKSLKIIAKQLSKSSGGAWSPRICTTPQQLEQELARV